MADNKDVLAGIKRKPGVVYSALTPTRRAFELAVSVNITSLSSYYVKSLDIWIYFYSKF